MSNSGTVAPGNSIGLVTVAGDATVGAGTAYGVEVNAAGANDKLVAGGTVTIDPTASVDASMEPGTYGAVNKYTIITGATAVKAAFAAGAARFLPEGSSRLEILQMEATGDVGYWSGIQRADVHMHSKDTPVPMDLRITELFRRQDGEWKLVHRHADMLKAQGGD